MLACAVVRACVRVRAFYLVRKRVSVRTLRYEPFGALAEKPAQTIIARETNSYPSVHCVRILAIHPFILPLSLPFIRSFTQSRKGSSLHLVIHSHHLSSCNSPKVSFLPSSIRPTIHARDHASDHPITHGKFLVSQTAWCSVSRARAVLLGCGLFLPNSEIACHTGGLAPLDG